jgi:hypothetical protein
MNEVSHHLGNDSSSFHPVNSLVREGGPLDLHHPKGRSQGELSVIAQSEIAGSADGGTEGRMPRAYLAAQLSRALLWMHMPHKSGES